MNKSKLTGIFLSSAAVLTGAAAMHHAPAQAQSQTKASNHVVLAQRAASENQTAVVIDGNGSLVLKSDASSNSAVSSYLSSGQMLTINSQSGAFYNVTVHETGATGYISANNIQIITNGSNDAFNALNEYGQVVNVSSSVHLRANASLNSSIVGYLQNGNTFKVLGKSGQWFKVDVNGTVGYIYQEYVSTSVKDLAPVEVSTNQTSNNNATPVKKQATKETVAQPKTTVTSTKNNQNTENNQNSKVTKATKEKEVAKTTTESTKKASQPEAQPVSFFAVNVNNNTANTKQNNNNNNNATQSNNNNNNNNAKQNNNNSNAKQNNNNSNAQQNNNNSNAQQNNNNSNAQQNNNNSNTQQNNNNSNAQQNNNNSNAQQNNNNNNNSNAQQSNSNNNNSQVSSSNATGQAIVNYAEQFLGRPYVWGATGPNAFDCSGLTSYVYKHFGYNIGRTTYTQVYQGTPVSLNNLQAGDLIFWGPASAPYHVAIYIGGGEYIQAPKPGENVDISSWNLNNVSAARRII